MLSQEKRKDWNMSGSCNPLSMILQALSAPAHGFWILSLITRCQSLYHTQFYKNTVCGPVILLSVISQI